MARNIPPLALGFSEKTDKALELVRSVERLRTLPKAAPFVRGDLTVHRLEFIYELAYLRIFLSWETFLEETFVRFLCGYTCSAGQEPLVTGSYCSNIRDGHLAIRTGRAYVLWHDPNTVALRCAQFFLNGHYEWVIRSHISALVDYARIRHRVVHDQDDAKRKFDMASMTLCGQRFPASRPGKMLRSWASQTERWIDRISIDLVGLAYQIAP